MPKIQSNLQVLPALDQMEFLRAKISGHRFPVHLHETFVIQLIQSGSDWCCVNNLTAFPDEVFVHFPNATHTGGTRPNSNLQYQAIYPSCELFSKVTGLDESTIPEGRSFTSAAPGLVRMARRLFRDLPLRECERTLRNGMSELFHEVLEQFASIQIVKESNSRNEGLRRKLERARDFIVQNAKRDVSISELSQHCELSQYHLIRSFKQRYGITPRRFLISQRVTLAKQLMATGMPLAAAAFTAGFSDQSHLARCFKSVTTCSPGQFQNASNASNDSIT